ncbi:MAG: aminoacyl-tRNA hydrolase, partial [Candidatus Wildermuthbacteria bacterium]|nr:aminoacyl-tRNA hydrolase [Candidatus Wildermuthbacteria bacterium]
MQLIVGLGNPGKKYEKTRHNAGFMVLDELEKKELPQTRLLKPDTFMNNSGGAVKKEMQKLKIKNQSLIIIHDDIDIPLGKIKVSKGSGSAGHKGVESIIQSLGTKEFIRIRIGILPPEGKPEDVETFVL